jgi:hypothetical protein
LKPVQNVAPFGRSSPQRIAHTTSFIASGWKRYWPRVLQKASVLPIAFLGVGSPRVGGGHSGSEAGGDYSVVGSVPGVRPNVGGKCGGLVPRRLSAFDLDEEVRTESHVAAWLLHRTLAAEIRSSWLIPVCREFRGGRCWDRTSVLCRVKAV